MNDLTSNKLHTRYFGGRAFAEQNKNQFIARVWVRGTADRNALN